MEGERKSKKLNKIRCESDNIAIHFISIKMNIGKYYEQLYAPKMITWMKWTNFQKHTPTKTDHEEIGNLNKPITIKEIE